VCVCALHIKWSTLVIHTALLWRGAIWQKLSNIKKMLRAQVISQQNTRTVEIKTKSQCVTLNFFKVHKNRVYRKYRNCPIFSNENIQYISDIYQWYISAIYIKPTLTENRLLRRKLARTNLAFCVYVCVVYVLFLVRTTRKQHTRTHRKAKRKSPGPI